VALRVAFFGTPAFAVPSLEALLASSHDVVGVVTQPDRPSGRGQKITFSPVKQRAIEAGVPILQPDRLKGPAFLDTLASWQPDLGVVAAYGKIIPEIVIDLPRYGLINVHASLLPKYRGAAPIQRAVMAGDQETGVTIMRIVKALDAGAMFATVVRPIAPDATSEDVEADLATAGARLLVTVVDAMEAGTAREEPQDDSRATYANKIERHESSIDWRRPAQAIHDQVRGLLPWPRASTTLDGHRVILTRSAVAGSQSHGKPGDVIEAHGDRLIVATGEGALRILALQPEGRRALAVREFLAGHPIAPGTRLGGWGGTDHVMKNEE
jgi:methionyl-tRNA formyltransferase